MGYTRNPGVKYLFVYMHYYAEHSQLPYFNGPRNGKVAIVVVGPCFNQAELVQIRRRRRLGSRQRQFQWLFNVSPLAAANCLPSSSQ